MCDLSVGGEISEQAGFFCAVTQVGLFEIKEQVFIPVGDMFEQASFEHYGGTHNLVNCGDFVVREIPHSVRFSGVAEQAEVFQDCVSL